MAIEEVNANTGVFPSPPVAPAPPEPAAIAALPPADVTANVTFPEPATNTEVAPEPSALAPVENERGENIDTTA